MQVTVMKQGLRSAVRRAQGCSLLKPEVRGKGSGNTGRMSQAEKCDEGVGMGNERRGEARVQACDEIFKLK